MTLGAVTAVRRGADVKDRRSHAYGDVRAAWKEYLAKYNKGRPFVLVGHSQGQLMLQTLLATKSRASRRQRE
jgi:alpha-beta hydrolase superfamily lysophospholipase